MPTSGPFNCLTAETSHSLAVCCDLPLGFHAWEFRNTVLEWGHDHWHFPDQPVVSPREDATRTGINPEREEKRPEE